MEFCNFISHLDAERGKRQQQQQQQKLLKKGTTEQKSDPFNNSIPITKESFFLAKVVNAYFTTRSAFIHKGG